MAVRSRRPDRRGERDNESSQRIGSPQDCVVQTAYTSIWMLGELTLRVRLYRDVESEPHEGPVIEVRVGEATRVRVVREDVPER
jgi:hypothetical protein